MRAREYHFNPNPEAETGEQERAEIERLFIERFEEGELLGEGKIGMVRRVEHGDNKICVKEIINTDHEEYCNSPEEEIVMQERVHKMGIRGPHALGVMRTENRSFIVMETIEGYSIRDIAQNNINLPDNFDVNNFLNTLRNQVRRMNDNNVYHRDLHDGNVMVEWETHEPIIIDFGTAIEESDEDSAYRVPTGKPSDFRLYPKDDEKIPLFAKMLNKRLQA